MTSITSLSIALACAALVACGGSTTDPSSTSSSGSPVPSGDAPEPGVFHLDQVDATNLEIRADGAFQWTIEGCDFGGGQCGSWTKEAGKLVFSGGPPGLEWTYDGSFKRELRALSVTKSGEDVLVTGETSDGEAFTQTWKKGRACAICGGQVGPTGQELCDAPLPKMCAR